MQAGFPTCLNIRGGDDGIRTHDPHVANVMLSQLSYIPTGSALIARGNILPVLEAFVKWQLQTICKMHTNGIYSSAFSSMNMAFASSAETCLRISPGWHLSTSHSMSSVLKRTALILPVLMRERLTLVIPTLSASSFSEICRSAMTSSR